MDYREFPGVEGGRKGVTAHHSGCGKDNDSPGKQIQVHKNIGKAGPHYPTSIEIQIEPIAADSVYGPNGSVRSILRRQLSS